MRNAHARLAASTAAILTAFACLHPGTPAHAATLTILPDTISNFYSGPITLQVTGLTNNEQVIVRRFMDANANGAVDPDETLVQSFKLRDGRFVGFAGIRDVSVPGDDDGATNGQIQAAFNFKRSAELSRGAGSYVFELVSPTGRFTPVTQTLTVTQSAFGQSVTGQVTSSSVPVPNAAVALLVQNGNNMEFVAGALADASGNFSLTCPAGGYVVFAIARGYVFDMGTAPFVSVNAGQVVTQNLNLVAATTSISGRVTDAVTSNGIPAVQYFIQSASGHVTISFSDTNGNLSIPVTAGQWQGDISDLSVRQAAYIRPNTKPQADTTAGSFTNFDTAIYRETALIFGHVRDQFSVALPGIALNIGDLSNQYNTSPTTDANGYYVGGVKAGSWFIGSDNSVTNYMFVGTNVNILDGQAIQVDLTASPVTAHLRGTVQDDHGNPIGNITLVVQPAAQTNGGGNSAYPTTDGSGNFDAPVAAGTWNIRLECNEANQGGYVNVGTYNYTVVDGVDQNGLSLVFPQVTALISGTVMDSLGNPVPNVGVNASSGNYDSGCITTDSGGNFQVGVVNGTWILHLNDWDLDALGYAALPSLNFIVSGSNQTTNLVVRPFPPIISQPRMMSGQFQFTLTGYDARQYRVESSTNLSTWTNLGTNQTSGGTLLFSDPNTASFPRRFYRATVVH